MNIHPTNVNQMIPETTGYTITAIDRKVTVYFSLDGLGQVYYSTRM